MCLIIDANVAGLMFGAEMAGRYAPVFDWLERDGLVATGGLNLAELERVDATRRYLLALKRAGKLHECHQEHLVQEAAAIEAACRSDDPHIIALARLSRARTLCTDDGKLMADFKDRGLVPPPRGAIYKSEAHQHLLRHTKGCPGR